MHVCVDQETLRRLSRPDRLVITQVDVCLSKLFAWWFGATHLGADVWDGDDLGLCDIRVGVCTRKGKCMAWNNGIGKDHEGLEQHNDQWVYMFDNIEQVFSVL